MHLKLRYESPYAISLLYIPFLLGCFMKHTSKNSLKYWASCYRFQDQLKSVLKLRQEWELPLHVGLLSGCIRNNILLWWAIGKEKKKREREETISIWSSCLYLPSFHLFFVLNFFSVVSQEASKTQYNYRKRVAERHFVSFCLVIRN
jgi:hypothetical protein